MRATLADDFHEFRLTLRHDGASVIAVDAEAERFPWTSCPSAVEPLRALAGMALSTDFGAARAQADPRMNCTHLFDLAGLAVAQAAAGRTTRVYDAMVPDRGHGVTRPQLRRDGEVVLEWDLKHQTIAGPDPFTGVGLRGAFLAWAADAFAGDHDMIEAATVLRRACEISFGRGMDLDAVPTADDMREVMLGTCHSFQPGVIEHALRVRGATRDFSAAPPPV